MEVALSLSLFLFLCFCFVMPMKMLDRQRQMQAIVKSVGEEPSQHAYVEYCSRTAEEGGAEMDVGRAEDTASSILVAVYASARVLRGINRERMEAASFGRADTGADEMAHIVMRYRVCLPFSILGINSTPVEQVCSRRMRNGVDGRRFRDGGRDGGGKEDKAVYIGKNSTRCYHSETCHYLYNDLKAVGFGITGELRNEPGRRYSPYGACGTGSGDTGRGGTRNDNVGSVGMVYATSHGASYHLSKSCRPIIVHIRAVPLSQVEYFRERSYYIRK